MGLTLYLLSNTSNLGGFGETLLVYLAIQSSDTG